MNVRTHPPRSRRHSRGLTYVELTIGMAITAVLMLALSTFAVAISAGWKHSDDEFKARSANTRSVSQIHDALRNMLCIVQANVGDADGGAAYLFCWQNDTNGGAADNRAQFGEMALVEFDPATKTVWLYEAKDTSAMTTAEKNSAASDSWGDYTSPAIVTYFKSSSFLAARKPLIGGYSTSGGKGVAVLSAQFGSFAANNGKPIASYRVTIGDADSSSAAYGNVALRAALKPTNLN